MAKKQQKYVELQNETNFHHLGSPDYAYECVYHKDNMEYAILFTANGSNEHFLGKKVKKGDELYLGLSEQDFESLLEGMISAVSDRLKDKLERYNNYKKEYYMRELDGNEEDWNENDGWNSLTNPYA